MWVPLLLKDTTSKDSLQASGSFVLARVLIYDDAKRLAARSALIDPVEIDLSQIEPSGSLDLPSARLGVG